MTVHDRARFKQAFNRLAVAVRLPADQADVAMQRVYWDGLETVPIEAIEAAAESLSRQAVWFPKLAEWLDAAVKAQNAQAISRALPAATRGWDSECQTCDDTGWEPLTCVGGRQCGRDREHGAHTYVVACACRETNHTYQRRRAEDRQRVQGKGEASQQQRRSGQASDFTRAGPQNAETI